MAWDNEWWNRFLEIAVQIASGRRHDWRNSFLLYPYEPADEPDALVQVQNASRRVSGNQITTQVISWGVYVATFLKNQGFLRRSVNTADESHRLQQNLAARLPEFLAENTERDLRGQPRAHIAFIVRTGAVFPFTTISQTLAACERREIGATLAVLGPGRTADRGRSFGLLTGPPHPGYPALIVGPTDEP